MAGGACVPFGFVGFEVDGDVERNALPDGLPSVGDSLRNNLSASLAVGGTDERGSGRLVGCLWF